MENQLYYNKIVKYKLIPFINEVLNCQIIDDDETCLKCSTSFFNNIIVKNEDLFEYSEYVVDDAATGKNKNNQKYIYVWNFDGNKLYFDKFQNARCRVKSVKMDQDGMTVYAMMDESGLGLTSWW